jgi:hypothetical protein
MLTFTELKELLPEFIVRYEKDPQSYRLAFLRLTLGARLMKPVRLRFEGNLYNPINKSGAIDVTRKGPYGNPYKVGSPYSLEDALLNYEKDLILGKLSYTTSDLRRDLEGKDLICWCKVDQPCHGDILITYANS